MSCRVREERTGGAENGSQHKGVRKSQAGSFSIEEKGVPEARGGVPRRHRKPLTFVRKRINESINVAVGIR